MALFPCSECGARYHGRQSTVYASVTQGQNRLTSRRRLCQTCFDRVMSHVRQGYADAGAVDDGYDMTVCDCGKSAELRAFVTAYDVEGEREDYFGGLCQSCLSLGAGMRLLGPAEHPWSF